MTDLEVYQPRAAAVAVPRDIDSWTQIAGQVIKLANEIYDTPFVPDGLRGSVPATAAAILAGRELGLEPLTSLANIHVIKGKPSLSAALMRALILAQGHQIETVDISDTRAVIRGRRRGESTWEEATFTADQAKRANIQLGGYPQDKLYARATSRLARRKFADVIAGMPYSAEELEDGPDGVVLADDPGYAAGRQAARAAGNGEAQKPAPRTGRRARAANTTPAAPQSPPRQPEAHAPASGPPLPPLPGEEPDPTPGPQQATGSSPSGSAGGNRATPGWVGLIVKHFERLGIDDRDERLIMTTRIAAREYPLESTKDLTGDEAKAVLDTLARCRDRERLVAILAERAAHAQAAAEGPQDTGNTDD